MVNYKQPGDVLTFTAPSGGVVSGMGYKIGAFFAVAAVTAAAAADFEGQVNGVFDLPKTSAQAWAVGDRIYWDTANSRADTSSAVGSFIGLATAVAANPSSTGTVRLNGTASARAAGLVVEGSATPTSKLAAGAVTLTAAELLTGIIVIDPGGAGRNVTLPTAALLVAAVPGAKVGDLIWTKIVNGADAAETLTFLAGSGGALDANQTATSAVIGQGASKQVAIRLTNVTASSEAYVAYV